MSLRSLISSWGMRAFSSPQGQAILDRTVERLDFWRGYGAGAYVESSGEEVLFDLVRGRASREGSIIIIDAGINAGNFAAAALDSLGPKVTVHGFEPARQMFAQTAARFRNETRISLHNEALGREMGESPLYGTSNDTGMASLVKRDLAHVGLTSVLQETVPVRRLADYCAAEGLTRIALLKIDVEGYELEVLGGAASLFERGQVDLCSFEFGGCNLDSRTFLRDFFQFFHRYGMRIFRITPTGTLVGLPRYREQLERFTTTNYVAMVSR